MTVFLERFAHLCGALTANILFAFSEMPSSNSFYSSLNSICLNA
ncbi:hypothetical protein CfE428DRAFT_0382 [Chthoniobacter flavus Ellin428]|uniref:Uncharacterized protein n=1 Tax=Chthoniobacter flavus Ellin428 TaxID=497964 RepID=B4CUL9_9BACT|nr:hypothetical protein CfE428DRAFT_0382 [Chthoniobacter flavus Ellin428]TCO94724.1 hypothetical protein EV701_102193 [Chthoniobacter flavus]